MLKFRRRKRRKVPALNTTATADISFMLLVFFLVTTSIDSDKGLNRMLPAIPQEETQKNMDVDKRNVLTITIDEQDSLRCEGQVVTSAELQERIEEFVEQVDREKHVLSIQARRNTSYNAYFAMQNAIVAAYNSLRNKYAKQHFGVSFDQCTAEQREEVAAYYPQRISEEEPE